MYRRRRFHRDRVGDGKACAERGIHRSPTASFTERTTQGNLLVAIIPFGAAGIVPSGCGWTIASTDVAGDRIVVWPNNPGGLQSFSVAGGTHQDIVLAEFSGTPAAVTQDHESDTGDQGNDIDALDLSSTAVAGPGELVVLYLDTYGSTSWTANSGWNSVGTDNNFDFAWWSVSGTVSPSATTSFTPASTADLMMVSFKAP